MSQKPSVSETLSSTAQTSGTPESTPDASAHSHPNNTQETDPERVATEVLESTPDEEQDLEDTKNSPPQNELPLTSADPYSLADESTLSQKSLASQCFSLCSLLGFPCLILFCLLQSIPLLLGHSTRGLAALWTELPLSHLVQATATTQETPFAIFTHPKLLECLAALQSNPFGLLQQWLHAPTLAIENLIPITIMILGLWLLVGLTWGLARATGNDKSTALASSLVMLCALTLVGLNVTATEDIFFAGLVTLSSLCLYRGWIQDKAPLWLFCGFSLLVPAIMLTGIAAIAILFGTSIVFLLWRGTFRRAGAYDGALAFGAMIVWLLLLGTWIGTSEGGRDLLHNLVQNNIISPIEQLRSGSQHNYWGTLCNLLFFWLPFLPLFFFLPWDRFGTFMSRILKNRTERPGQGWIWLYTIIGVAAFSLLPTSPTMLLALFPPLAILTAQGLLSLSSWNSRAVFFLASLCMLLLAVAVACTSLAILVTDSMPDWLHILQPTPLPLQEELTQAIGLFIMGLLLWKATNRSSASGSLLVVYLLLSLFTITMSYTTEKVTLHATTPVVQDALQEPASSPTEQPTAQPAQPSQIQDQSTEALQPEESVKISQPEQLPQTDQPSQPIQTQPEQPNSHPLPTKTIPQPMAEELPLAPESH